MIEITNRATPMIARPAAACFNILNHCPYWSSFPAAVTIWNPPYSKTSNAINAKIHNTRFTTDFITLIRASFWFHESIVASCRPMTSILWATHVWSLLTNGFWLLSSPCAYRGCTHTTRKPIPKIMRDRLYIHARIVLVIICICLFLNKIMITESIMNQLERLLQPSWWQRR